MIRLKFTLRATHDLKRLHSFIADNNPAAARNISQRLKQGIHHLIQNPKLGKMLDEPPNVRDFIVESYLVCYTVVDGTVIILKIWHGKENR